MTGRYFTLLACLGLLLSPAVQAGGVNVHVPGIDVRLPAPPLPRVTVVAPPVPEVRVYEERRYYDAPPPRHYEHRYHERRDYRDDRYDDDRYEYRHHRHHHHHDRYRGW